MGYGSLKGNMQKLITLPEAWFNILAQVRSVLPSAYLAGGAIRDYDNGRPVKDLDVFFTEPFEFHGPLDKALEGLYLYRTWCPGQYMDTQNEVGSTFTYDSLCGLPQLNLIQLDKQFNPPDIIERVDFGLCQIGADQLGVEFTAAYEFDKANQCLTLTRAESVQGVKRSLRRYERLSKKYEGWRLNVPLEFEALVSTARAEASVEATF
jgi:hypothetical protein